MTIASKLLFGEGKTEAVLLTHLKNLYSNSGRQRVKVSKAQGGSPDCIVNRMISAELQLASYDGSLLLLDSDVTVEPKTAKKIQSKSITLVSSQPKCIEGLMLQVLCQLPKGGVNATSQALKRKFRKVLEVENDSDALRTLSQKVSGLFSKKILETARKTCPELEQILSFIEA